MMHLALASNQAYFPGLACAALSVLAASEGDEGMTFHVLDGGIEPKSWQVLEAKLAASGKNARLMRHPLSFDKLAGLPVDYGNGVMTYARLLMTSLIEEDTVIYLDVDILVFRDLRALWNDPMEGKLVAACLDHNVPFLAHDSLFELTEDEAKLPYFNAGFMKVDLKRWRQEDIQGQALRLVRDHREKCTWWDQTALNTCLKGKVKFLDRNWNRFCFEVFTPNDFSADGINIHYVSKVKPWMTYDSRDVTYILWRMFRAKWLPETGGSKSGLAPLKRRGDAAAIGLLSQCGGVLAGGLEAFCGLLERTRIAPMRPASHWLRKQKPKFEIIKTVGDRLRRSAPR